MKHTKRKLVLIMLASMVIAFAVIAVAFQLIINSYVKNRASNSISYYMSNAEHTGDPDKEESDLEEPADTMVVISFIYQTEESEPKESEDDEVNFWDNFWNTLFDEDFWNSEDVMQDYYSDEIVEWWTANQPEEYSMNRLELDGKVLYVSWMQDGKRDDRIRFYYVNVTSEEQLIRTVSISLYIIMGICLAGACLVGYLMGRKIETGQNQQKQFFENASHELKTPLMSIQAYAEGLEAGIIREPEKATRVILNETDKMTGLVSDILSISRLESGAYKLKKELLSMPEFLSECLTSLEAAIYEKNLRVGFDVAKQSVAADRVQLEKAVRNILSNAIRYARTEIRISYDGKKLIIWDDGTPISEESLKHLFERFYTGPNGNTGIGMSLTKEIVEQHGWKIKAENTAAGAQFVIFF